MPRDDTPFVIEATQIVKNFAGVQALRGVDFRVHRGEIHALLGQNGAGKSTLVKILNGVHGAGSYEGEIRVDGKPVRFSTPGEARAQGVAYVPQETEVFEQLTVAENVFAGRTNLGRGVLISQKALRARTAELFRDFGLDLDPGALVATLTAAERHLVMIVRALTTRPLVLMLDEPTASLSGSEVALLFALLERLKASGTTMIFITHRLPEVVALCDRATVLRDGRVAAEFVRGDFDEERIIAAMSGERLSQLYPHHDAPTAERRDAAPHRRAQRRGALWVASRRSRCFLRSSGGRDPRHCRAARVGAKRAARGHLRPHPAPRTLRRRRPRGRYPLDPGRAGCRHRSPHRGSQAIGAALQSPGRR